MTGGPIGSHAMIAVFSRGNSMSLAVMLSDVLRVEVKSFPATAKTKITTNAACKSPYVPIWIERHFFSHLLPCCAGT